MASGNQFIDGTVEGDIIDTVFYCDLADGQVYYKHDFPEVAEFVQSNGININMRLGMKVVYFSRISKISEGHIWNIIVPHTIWKNNNPLPDIPNDHNEITKIEMLDLVPVYQGLIYYLYNDHYTIPFKFEGIVREILLQLGKSDQDYDQICPRWYSDVDVGTIKSMHEFICGIFDAYVGDTFYLINDELFHADERPEITAMIPKIKKYFDAENTILGIHFIKINAYTMRRFFDENKDAILLDYYIKSSLDESPTEIKY